MRLFVTFYLACRKSAIFSRFLGERRYARSGRRERDTCDGREAPKKAQFFRAYFIAHVSRSTPVRAQQRWKKRLFCRLLYFQNPWTKSYDVSTSSESSLVELLHITIYLCFRISEQTWIWFFCEFFLWSLLLSSDRVTRFKRLGYFFALNKYKPANYIKHKILVRVR